MQLLLHLRTSSSRIEIAELVIKLTRHFRTPAHHRPGWAIEESTADPPSDGWPERSVLPGSHGNLNVVASTSSKWVPIRHIDVVGPLPLLEDLDLPALNSAHDNEHEEMPLKARKRGRTEVVFESDPEDVKRPLVMASHTGDTAYDAESERDDASNPDSIPDTTITVHIDPDVTSVALSPPSFSFTFQAPALSPLPSSISETHGVANITPLSERTVLDPSDRVAVSPPFPATPTVILEPPTKGSDIMESPSSGDSTVAASPQQHIMGPDTIKPPDPIESALPATVNDRLVSVVLPSDDNDQPSDRTQSNVDGEEVIDIPGHELWDDDRCSSPLSSPPQDGISPGEQSLLCSEPGFPSSTPSSPDRFEDAQEGAIRGSIEALLSKHLESSASSEAPPK